MLNEFYRYIAKKTVEFFRKNENTIRKGERYCLKLDNEKIVHGVDQALRDLTVENGIQGSYKYKDVYETITIQLANKDFEVVVASKINGMTDDFLATLRNAELTPKQFPILMITYSPIDTISSGTGDLSAKGMPFHIDTIIENVKEEISKNFSKTDRALIEYVLDNKKNDRFGDKSSLYEYKDLLSALENGSVSEKDYALFSLFNDPVIKQLNDETKIRKRLEENHKLFGKIDHIFHYGNITEDLSTEYEKSFIETLNGCKKEGKEWYEEYTFDKVKDACIKTKNKSLQISDYDIMVYSADGDPFTMDENVLIRNDGDSKAAQRKKNILIYNSEQKSEIIISVKCNIAIHSINVEPLFKSPDITYEKNQKDKEILIHMKANGCNFSSTMIEDGSSNKYFIKVCILNISPEYLENIQTNYNLNVKKRRSVLQVAGVKEKLIINPRKETEIVEVAKNDHEYICNYNQTLTLEIKEENFDIDKGILAFNLKSGLISIPLEIKDESIKATEITGVKVFKEKYTKRKSLEYRNGKIVSGTNGYFIKDDFRIYMEWETQIINNGWLAAKQTINDSEKLEKLDINVSDEVEKAYKEYLNVISSVRSLPSLVYLSGEIKDAALKYIDAVTDVIENIQEGQSLSQEQHELLLLGAVVQDHHEKIIAMSPLHPLNVLYHLALIEEMAVGDVRTDLVEKLSPLYLLPYIKYKEINCEDVALYRAVEQEEVPEWRLYAQQSDKRYHGSRSYVKDLVCDKINQYISHFPFLFEDIGNDQFCINLISMGDGKEVLQGICRYYIKEIKRQVPLEKLMTFIVNIYDKPKVYSDFYLLSNQKKLHEFICEDVKDVEDVNEMATILTNKVHCYYRNLEEPHYQYAHLSFYEMSATKSDDTSRMDNITTGISLNGIVSGVPSVLDNNWHKTGFGTKYAVENDLLNISKRYNALFRVAFSGSAYEPESCIFTSIEKNMQGQLEKIYDSSNWVVFVDPKVELSFFKENEKNELMIIHYSDQCTTASGYDNITVTRQYGPYEEIIRSYLKNKGISVEKENVREIVSFFNAVNGDWMLQLLSAQDTNGNHFSREKMSIISAIKICMAYYDHPNIVWIPVSLEELLRVSGGAGYSKNEGLLSAKNLGFDQGATSDDLLMIGIEGPLENIKIYMHPVEVKIGKNYNTVLEKADKQVGNTYSGFWNALWPNDGKYALECKLTRNFFMQHIIICCEKMKLYDVYSKENWELVIDKYREALLNEKYIFSNEMDQYIGKSSVISFKSEIHDVSCKEDNGIYVFEFPENKGYSYIVNSSEEIEQELSSYDNLPDRLMNLYKSSDNNCENLNESYDNGKNKESVDVAEEDNRDEDTMGLRFLTSTEDINADQDEKKMGIEVLFGTDLTDGQPVYWKPNDTNQVFHPNTGIIGTMGTGKTQFTKSIITQLYRNQKDNFAGEPLGILIFDYKGDYNESKEDFITATNATVLKPYHLPFNPLALTKSKVFKPLLPIHIANSFKDTLSKVYNLGPKQQNTLFSCITSAYKSKGILPNNENTWQNIPPTFDTVYNIYQNDDEIKKTDSLAAAMDKLSQFQVFEGDPAKTVSLFDLLNGVVVIDLSGYDSDIQSLVVAITLDQFYSQMQAAGSSKMDQQYRQLTKLILVDEADNFMSEGFPALKKILKEGREFGVGTILSTQFLKHFGSGEDDYSKYILTWVVHNVADLKNSDVDFVFKVEPKSVESQRLFNDIKALKKHHSIIKISNFSPKYIEDRAFWELYRDLNLNQ